MVPTWMLGSAAMVAVVSVLLIEDLASRQLYVLTLRLPGIDKALHFIQSCVICLAMNLLLQRSSVSAGTRIALAAAAALAAAGFDEFQQSLRSDRNVEAADVGAGLAGIAAAVAMTVRGERPRLASGVAAIALVVGGLFVYSTYLKTHHYNSGLRAERAGRYDEALRHYREGIEADANNPELYNAAAWMIAESGHGEPQEAVAYAERSLQLRPNDADTLDTYGWSLYLAGRAADAVAPLEAALAAKPGIYCVHYHLGMVYLKTGRTDIGVDHLRQQIERMPLTREATLASEVLAGLHQAVRRNP